jgi:hypothetical protein
MSRKKKRPLPPRTLRMDRAARLQSARSWLTTQGGRPARRIAKSYRKRFGVDWLGAIAELTALGIAFEAKWREQIACTVENDRRAKARRRAKRSAAAADAGGQESNEHFAFIAGYTEGGAPFGVTWEEWEASEHNQSSDHSPVVAHFDLADGERLPF